MKCKPIDRVLLILLALAGMAAGVFVLLFAWDLLQAEYLSWALTAMQGYWVNTILFTLAGAAVVLVCLRLFYSACFPDVRTKNPASAMVGVTENGSVHIALSTVELMIKQYVINTKGVMAAQTKTVIQENGYLSVTLKIAVRDGYSIPELTMQVQNGLKEHIQTITGLTVGDIAVLIDASIAPKTSVSAPAKPA